MARFGRVHAVVSLVLLVGVTAVTTCASPDQLPGYVARAAVFQGRLLWGRVPLEQALPTLSPERAARAALVPRVKDFAERRLGLRGAGIYDQIHPTWTGVVWNVSACAPLAFENRTWWFPIVGEVPYLGYFDRALADRRAARLQAEGDEVWVRPAGTYSTLGWFDDPVLPNMLDWDELRLADTLIHELVHANVWVPGSVSFNESLASFVGRHGAIAWTAEAYGEGSAAHADAVRDYEDQDRFRALLHDVTAELGAIYEDGALPDDEKRSRKAAVFAGLPERARAAGFHDPARYEARFADGTWNNARLLQYRTYGRGQAAFDALYQAEGRDLSRFLDRIRTLAAAGGDPWAALSASTGVSGS